MKLPKTVFLSNFHCLEGCNIMDCIWEGVKIKDIEKIVKPQDVASAVTFGCVKNYFTSFFK